MSIPREVTDAEFQQEVLDADLPVMVDFWAEWCGPCRVVSPIVEELAEEYDGKVKFVKLDTEENFEIPTRYGVLRPPHLAGVQGRPAGRQDHRLPAQAGAEAPLGRGPRLR